MSDNIECKNCGNVIDIDAYDIQKRFNEVLVLIQFGTNKKVVSLSLLTVLDDCIKCCNRPDYCEV